MKFERRRAWRPIAVIIAVAALIATLTTAVPTAAAPGDNHTYSGTVTATGGGALSGMTVSVFCSGICNGSGSVSDPDENPRRPWSSGSELLGEDTTDGSGDWSVTITEPAGSGSVEVIAWDPAGDRAVALGFIGAFADQAGINMEMSDGGVVSGTISTTDGSPVPDVPYTVRGPAAGFFGSVATTLLVEPDGSFSTPAFANGTVTISYNEVSPPFVAQSFATLGSISGGANTTADHEIQMAGSMSGRVTNGSGTGLGGILVSAFGNSFGFFGGISSATGGGGSFQVFTEPDGTYDVDELVPGDWTVEFIDPAGTYGSQFYDGAISRVDADAAVVPSNGEGDGIDAELGMAGRIMGSVQGGQGLPFDTSVSVCTDPDFDGSDFTSCRFGFTEGGMFSFEGLGAGTYYVSVNGPGSDRIYFGGGAAPGSPVVVAAGGTRQTDFEVPGGRIAGEVTDGDGDPLAGLAVSFFDPVSFDSGSTQVGPDGTYLSPLLPPGSYRVTFGNFRDYDDEPVGSGDLVDVDDGETTPDIDAELTIGSISGTVVSDGSPLAGVNVSVSGPTFATVRTDADGEYHVAVTEGDYRVSFSSIGYLTQYFDGADFATADLVTVSGSADVGDIDADMELVPVPTPPPAGVDVGGSDGTIQGVPSFFGSSTIEIDAEGCPNGSASVTFSDDAGFFTTAMPESPTGSGTYSLELPASLTQVGGRSDVSIFISCPDFDDSELINFNIYIDPAGTVVDQRGNPIEGATVTLMQDNPDTIPVDFEVVPDGSAVMDPTINNTNPDTTGSDGAFRWDVVAGLWKVRAEAPNCHAPGDSSTSFVETEELIVPPPRLGLVLELECTPVCPSDGFEDPFTDVPDTSFASGPVSCIYELGVTTGTSATTYSPGNEVTREQMAAFLARLYEAITGSAAPVVTTPFTDLTEASSFAQDPIAQIYGLGITTGTSPTTYSPKDLVTRQQMAAFLARLFEAATGSAAPVVTTPFTDLGDASPFARDPIAQIYGLGVTTGTSATTYSPLPNVTRDQMAAFLARLYVAAY